MSIISELRDSNHPILIIIRGVPGSGKSYLATALQESIGEKSVVILDPDRIDHSHKEYTDLSKTLTAEGVDSKFHPYRFLRSKAYEAITAHKIIIWNQGFIDFEGFKITVERLKTFASEHDIQLPVLVVEVEVNAKTAKKRVAIREARGGHGVPEGAFARFVGQYESFSERGYRTVVVNGENNVSASVSSVLSAIEELRSSN